AGRNHFVAAGQRNFERLLDDNVLAGGGRGEGRFQMRSTGRADIDDVEPGVLQKFVVVGVNRASANDRGDLLPVLALRSKDGDGFRPADVADRPRMKRRNHPTANDSKTDFAHDRCGLTMSINLWL